MISNKKAQGLPINTIILIAIGLLILVLLVTFVLGGFKGLGGGASTSSSAISAFEAQCQTTALLLKFYGAILILHHLIIQLL